LQVHSDRHLAQLLSAHAAAGAGAAAPAFGGQPVAAGADAGAGSAAGDYVRHVATAAGAAVGAAAAGGAHADVQWRAGADQSERDLLGLPKASLLLLPGEGNSTCLPRVCLGIAAGLFLVIKLWLRECVLADYFGSILL
jgi:hypothetical protein